MDMNEKLHDICKSKLFPILKRGFDADIKISLYEHEHAVELFVHEKKTDFCQVYHVYTYGGWKEGQILQWAVYALQNAAVQINKKLEEKEVTI